MASVGIVSTTDALSATTESLKILSTTMAAPSDASDAKEHSTDIGQMAKLITVPNAITTIAPASFVQLNEASTTSLTTTIAESDDSNNKNNGSGSGISNSSETDNVSSNNESSMTAAITKTHASVDATKNNVQDDGSILMGSSVSDESNDGPTMKNGNANANAQRVSINDVTNGPTTTATATATDAIVNVEEATKSPAISSSTSANIIKVNDRSRVVSKDDIESIRGRALNLTSNEHQQSMPGSVIYVTAPPVPLPPSSAAAAATTEDKASHPTAAPVIPAIVKPKSAKAKSFRDDLSDVSMDNDGLDFQSSEHVAMMTTTTPTTRTTMTGMKTTTLTPLIHDSQCQSKVRFLNNLFLFVCTRINLICNE